MGPEQSQSLLCQVPGHSDLSAHGVLKRFHRQLPTARAPGVLSDVQYASPALRTQAPRLGAGHGAPGQPEPAAHDVHGLDHAQGHGDAGLAAGLYHRSEAGPGMPTMPFAQPPQRPRCFTSHSWSGTQLLLAVWRTCLPLLAFPVFFAFIYSVCAVAPVHAAGEARQERHQKRAVVRAGSALWTAPDTSCY